MDIGIHHKPTPGPETGTDWGAELPPMLIYPDDILLIGLDGCDLQYRLRLVQLTLGVVGLHLNLNKCSILQGPEGERYGVETFIFLGIPLGFVVTAQDTLLHCLHKSQSSYYAFKRIMDSTNSALATKVSIFQTYISSRWLWAAPAVFPTTHLLRKVESLRNTLLLSLFRLPTDGLLDWVTNEVSRRRVVRHLCDKLPNMPQWGR